MSNATYLVRTTLPRAVRLEQGKGDLPRLSVESALGVAEVYFHGAHITAWHPASARSPVLWMSRSSSFEAGKPIRGGVPVCFPWFGAHPGDPTAPPHGFARLRAWTLVDAREEAGVVTLEMELADRSSPQWPHRFRMLYRIAVGDVLRMELEVQNTGSDEFAYEEALHTYFDVHDIGSATVTGLEGTDYLDKVAGLSRQRQGADPIRFTGETDRIYLDTRAACVIHDRARARRITISKNGSDATVVWNPWVDKARAMPDFGDDEWQGMLCVETCNVNVHARTLSPGESHTMTAVIEVDEGQANA
jgi:glucose-6-phosphate 1-epimerase